MLKVRFLNVKSSIIWYQLILFMRMGSLKILHKILICSLIGGNKSINLVTIQLKNCI